MLQKFKTIFPWALNVVLLVIILWPDKDDKSLTDTESTIETRTEIEESLVDSFSSERDQIILRRDSSLQRIDTLEVHELMGILKENMIWYENKNNLSPWSLDFPRDSVGEISGDRE